MHRARLGDWFTQATRIRFSVHTLPNIEDAQCLRRCSVASSTGRLCERAAWCLQPALPVFFHRTPRELGDVLSDPSCLLDLV